MYSLTYQLNKEASHTATDRPVGKDGFQLLVEHRVELMEVFDTIEDSVDVLLK